MFVKVNFNNYSYIQSFTSRKKEIREADKIERKTREVFPLTSATYIDAAYLSAKPGSVHYKKVSSVSDTIQNKILTMRDIQKNPEFYHLNIPEPEKSIPYASYLNMIKQMKLGNCKENAIAALAVLVANGYYNSSRVELAIQSDFIHKEIGKLEFSDKASLDHSFVITDMNVRNKKDIVIDPWLGFADSISGAMAKFKCIYTEKDIAEAKHMHHSLFKIHLAQKGMLGSLGDYEQKTKFVLIETDPYMTEYQKKRLGDYTGAVFDDVHIN